MTTTINDFAEILKRQKRLGTWVLVLGLFTGSVISLVAPLNYEAVVGIEKRQAQISLEPVSSEYDVTRYTSEDERTLAVLKSRYMMFEWLKAIGISYSTPRQLEKQLRKLDKHFVLKPVNFTNFYMLRVQAETPQEAGRRADLIVKLFQKWDSDQAESESQEVIGLIQKRLETVTADLARKRKLVKDLKLSRTINLSGSTSESGLDTDIRAKQNLYDGLTDELEKAERGTDALSVQRVRVAIPLTICEKPIHSRIDYMALTVCLSLLLAMSVIGFKEWQNSPRLSNDEANRFIENLPAKART